MKLFRTEQSSAELQDLAARDIEEHVVECILEHSYSGPPGKRLVKSHFDFKVRWLGYSPDDDTWLPYSAAKELAALDEYLEQHPELVAALGG